MTKDNGSERKIKPVVARPLSQFANVSGNDPQELLKHRFLCRHGGLLLCAPTGIGKSAFTLQCLIAWACGRSAFGIAAAEPLRSYLFQGENDDGEIAEMRDGIYAGLDLNSEERAEVENNVAVVREDERTGLFFFADVVRPVMENDIRDIIAIDPVLSFVGGDASSQKDVGPWLRNGLNPLLKAFNCGAFIVHHTNKPASGREKPQWQAGDFAYLGAGSAEWANWARAVLAIKSIGSHDVFEIHAGKRGARLGWKDDEGNKAFSKYLAHANDGSIYWSEVDGEDVNQGGRPRQFDADEVLGLLPPEGMTAGEWQGIAFKECGVKEATFHRHRRELAKQDRVIKSKINGKWQPVTKHELSIVS